MATTTTYASELIGKPARDPEGRLVGTIVDLLVPADTDYPVVGALRIKPKRGDARTIPWSAVRVVGAEALILATSLEQAPDGGLPSPSLSLAHQVLDRQIIDTNGVRVVRVNDLQLAEAEHGGYRVIGIDISAAGLLRRLGVTSLLGLFGVRPTPRTIAWQDVEPVESGAAGVKLRVSHEDLARLRPADIAHILSQLDQVHGGEVLSHLADLDDEAAAEAFSEVPGELQVALIRGMDAERAADILEEMDPDDAADLLGDLAEQEPERAADLLERMEDDEAEDVRTLLAYDDETAGGLMTTDFVTVSADVTAEEAIARVRGEAAAMDAVYDVYAIDADEHLVGDLSLRELIVAEPGACIRDVMRPLEEMVLGHTDDQREEVARLIARYNLLALPILDDEGRLRGIVTVDDAMDVILPSRWKARLPRVFARAP